MAAVHPVIPIASAPAASACASATVVAGACSAAAGCASSSACAAGGGADPNDPGMRLAQQGWVLRTTIGEPRLSEVAENYRAMGYEVHVEYLAPAPHIHTADASACTTCFDADPQGQSQRWGSVYVRAAQARTLNDELY
ncbi:MAG: hypothetical protein ACT4NV_18160 [Rhodoferax sp.]